MFNKRCRVYHHLVDGRDYWDTECLDCVDEDIEYTGKWKMMLFADVGITFSPYSDPVRRRIQRLIDDNVSGRAWIVSSLQARQEAHKRKREADQLIRRLERGPILPFQLSRTRDLEELSIEYNDVQPGSQMIIVVYDRQAADTLRALVISDAAENNPLR